MTELSPVAAPKPLGLEGALEVPHNRPVAAVRVLAYSCSSILNRDCSCKRWRPSPAGEDPHRRPFRRDCGAQRRSGARPGTGRRTRARFTNAARSRAQPRTHTHTHIPHCTRTHPTHKHTHPSPLHTHANTHAPTHANSPHPHPPNRAPSLSQSQSASRSRRGVASKSLSVTCQ